MNRFGSFINDHRFLSILAFLIIVYCLGFRLFSQNPEFCLGGRFFLFLYDICIATAIGIVVYGLTSYRNDQQKKLDEARLVQDNFWNLRSSAMDLVRKIDGNKERTELPTRSETTLLLNDTTGIDKNALAYYARLYFPGIKNEVQNLKEITPKNSRLYPYISIFEKLNWWKPDFEMTETTFGFTDLKFFLGMIKALEDMIEREIKYYS